MGGSGSTRRVVVEEVDGSGVVKISDSVVKRIRGQEDTASDATASAGNAKARDTAASAGRAGDAAASTVRAGDAPASAGRAGVGAGSARDAPSSTYRSPPSSSPIYTRPPPSDQGKAMNLDIEGFYTDKLIQLEQRNSELQKITNEQFVRAVQEVEQKFLRHTCSPVCQDMQSKVYECYLGNPKLSLNCSSEVRAFSTCVERARQNTLLRKS